tara:strand:- start:1435 stop:2556 length:1122 start_codon:yes stop_codon:yes gene_type:complete
MATLEDKCVAFSSETYDKVSAMLDEISQRDPGSAIMCAQIAGLMIGYIHEYREDHWTVEAVEEEFLHPVVNPGTGRPRRNWVMVGKMDARATERLPMEGGDAQTRRLIVEHKTTSESLDADGPFWKRTIHDTQISHYLLSEWMEGRSDGILYDVIRKPTIRPKVVPATQKDSELGTKDEVLTKGTYYGFPVNDDDADSVRMGAPETPFLYFARVAHVVISDPAKHFARRVITRSNGQLVEHAQVLVDITKDIDTAYREDRHYKNRASCFLWNRVCPFYDLCGGHDTPTSEKWVQGHAHPELSDEIRESEDKAISNSRLKSFQTCRQKEYYQYGLGLKRSDEDFESPALYFGTVFHQAMELYWMSLGQDKGGQE